MDNSNLMGRCFCWSEGDDIGFSDIISSYLSSTEAARGIADAFEVAVSSVFRWATGLARPDPLMQRLIVDWIAASLGASQAAWNMARATEEMERPTTSATSVAWAADWAAEAALKSTGKR